MASDFFKSILDREIASKINLLLGQENGDIEEYKLTLHGKGLNFTLEGSIATEKESTFKKVEDITINGVIDLLNRQVDEYDFFSPAESEVSFNYIIENIVKTRKQGIVGNIRLKSGKFTNPLQLSNLINLTLVRLVKERMGRRGALVYRTGRLAHSGFVTNIIANSLNSKTIYFSYLKRPYSVFEPPNTYRNLASPARDPRRLFARAINDALKKLLHKDALESNTFGIRIGNYLVGKSISGVLDER